MKTELSPVMTYNLLIIFNYHKSKHQTPDSPVCKEGTGTRHRSSNVQIFQSLSEYIDTEFDP